MEKFTPEEVAHCKAAMAKPAPLDALRLIASGQVLIELTGDRRDVLLTYRGERLFLSGAWPLYRAGMINEFGVVTDAGRKLLEQAP